MQIPLLQAAQVQVTELGLENLTKSTTRPNSHSKIEMGRAATPLGPLIMGIQIDQDGQERLAMLEFSDRRKLDTQLKTLAKQSGCLILPGHQDSSGLACELHRQLDAYFAGKLTNFDLPLVTFGTAFQTQVWQALCQVPHGETRSYGDIAATVNHPTATRAVGTANGKNRIAIVIPCHRVLRSNGSLSGYAGGPWRKQALLELEGHHIG